MGFSGELAGSGSLIKCLVVEALGTFVFSYVYLNLLTGGGASNVGSMVFMFLAVLTVLNWVCFPLSGGHFNPCVTLALLVKSKIEVKKGLFYLLAQLGATFLAGLILYINLNQDNTYGTQVKNAWWNIVMPRALQVNNNKYLTMIYEFIGTFVFILVFFAANVGKGGTNVISGFVIALGYCFANSMIYTYSRGTLNPYLYICPRLLTMDLGDILWYILGPPLGAVAGAFLYEPMIGDSISQDETPLTELN